jgi:predicted HTH domain antitoxin
MSITVEIPDDLAKKFPTKEAASRELLESYAAEAYRTRRISRRQVGLLLGFNRWEAEDFLAKRNALREFTVEDYEMEIRSGR